jgi:two-component system cell cycle sensor histidine kinase/response regulator CckA
VHRTLAVALKGWVTGLPGVWLSPDFDRTGLAPAASCVLVVDDDKNVRRLTARMLRAEGYKVLEAESGPAALIVLENETVTLLVTDIVMPEMHGLELADRARQLLPKLRVLLITGHALELTGQLGLREGSLPVLLKPFSKDQLSSKVREALADERH